MEPYEECVGHCRAAVESLRAEVHQAKSHRARCCQVLAAALAASLALEHALHSGELSPGQAQRLHKLSALTVAAVELAHQHVQAFSTRPSIIRLATNRNKETVDRKFSEVTLRLDELTQQVWDLQIGEQGSPRRSGGVCNLLEQGLTPESAARTTHALGFLARELASGRLDSNAEPASVQITQPGTACALDREQAVHVINQLSRLLHIMPPATADASSSQQASSAETTDSATQTSPRQLASFDSARSREEAFMTDPADSPSGDSFTQPSTSAASSSEVQRAAPPPSNHAEHALQASVQRPQSALVSREASETSVNPQHLQGTSLDYDSQPVSSDASRWSASAQQTEQNADPRLSPFDIGRRHTWTHEDSPLRPPEITPRPRSSSESQRIPRWTDEQAQQRRRSHEGRQLSSITQSELQAHLHAQAMQSDATTVPRRRATAEPLHHGSGQQSYSGYSPSPYRRSRDDQVSSRSSWEVLEAMNCSVIEYNQLQIKRKIGDGSIGLVYLGRWQETDVAIKVLIEMQHLAPNSEVQPQDPATLQPWTESSDDNHPQQGGEKKKVAKGLIGVTDAEAVVDDGQPTVDSLDKPATAAMRTLEREVSIMASLRHPNVVMFMGMCLEPPCIVTEFCARGSLFDVLRKARTSPAFAQQLDWSRRLSMALDAAKGVLHLHSHKPSILHRDLKSPNMLVERHWRVKVTDFNLSRMVQTNGSGSSVNSLLANNPRWLAPEVVENHDHSKAADVYSFGIIMWEMMTWDMPWEELNPFQIMLRLAAQDRPAIPDLAALPGQPLPGIKEYIDLMKACWNQEPSDRPSFQHVIVSIRGLLEGATSKQKLQKTLTEVPRLATSSMVPPNLNKLPVVGQTPHRAAGPAPQQTPTPLRKDPGDESKRTPLQIYETDRPFFGSAPVGGLELLSSAANQHDQLENVQYHPLSGAKSQQKLRRLRHKNQNLVRRHTFSGGTLPFQDMLETAPHFPAQQNSTKSH